jgi:hypothetical protein
MWLMPEITGHPKILIGSDVNFYGFVGITSGRIFDEPRLVIGDRVDVGHNVSIVVNKERDRGGSEDCVRLPLH